MSAQDSTMKDIYVALSEIHLRIRTSWRVKEPLNVNGNVATVLGSIPASSDTAESARQRMKQCWIKYFKESHQSLFRELAERYLSRLSFVSLRYIATTTIRRGFVYFSIPVQYLISRWGMADSSTRGPNSRACSLHKSIHKSIKSSRCFPKPGL